MSEHYRKGHSRPQTAGSRPLPRFQLDAKLTPEAWAWNSKREIECHHLTIFPEIYTSLP